MKTSRLHKSVSRQSLLTLMFALALGLGGVSLTGCNTAEGVGEDVEAAGEGVQDLAN